MMAENSCFPSNTGLFFNGAFYENSEPLLESRNPATGEYLLSVSQASPSIVDQVVEHAFHAQPDWAKLDIRDRVACIRRFIRVIE